MSLRAHSLERPQQVAAECGLDRDSLSEGGSSTTSGSTEGTGGSRPSSPHLPYTPKHNKGCTSSTCQDSHKVSGTLADVRLRVLLCRKAWSLLIRSKMSLSLSSLTKFHRLALVIVIGLLVSIPLVDYFQSAVQMRPYQRERNEDSPIGGTNLHLRAKRESTNGKWIAIKDTDNSFPKEGYIYSAFYDDRKSLQTLPVIRIIAVIDELDKADVLYCLSYFKLGNRHTYQRILPAPIGIGVKLKYRPTKLMEYLMTCRMLDEEVPDMVGIVDSEQVRTTAMVPLEIPERPAQVQDFGACISVTYWRQNPYHIVEWMEMLRILGVSGVTVYNNSLEHNSSKVFLEYAQEGFVDFRQSHNFLSGVSEMLIHMHMSPVINDCMYRNMYKFRRIVVTDFDELIIPRNADTYTDMIDEIYTKGKYQVAKSLLHFIFPNSYFFLDTPGEDTSQSPHLLTLRHRRRVPVSGRGYAVKSIISPRTCVTMHNHACWRASDMYVTGMISIEVHSKFALNQHYKRCHFDKWRKVLAKYTCTEYHTMAIQDDVMMRYKDRLEQRVGAKLVTLQLGTV